MKKTKSSLKPTKPAPENQSPARTRIIYAAVAAFLERGYTNVSMLDIATRAQVSNRDLYAEFENKAALLAYCITSRAQKMKLPEGLPTIVDGQSLTAALVIFGENLLQELSDPEVLLMYYLAIMESWRAPEVGKTIDEFGRNATQHALMKLLEQAQTKRLIEDGDAGKLANQFLSLLCGDLLLRLLLRVVLRPSLTLLRGRAVDATEAFLALHSLSKC